METTQAMIDRVKARWSEWGYSWWSFFDRSSGLLVGAGCIQRWKPEDTEPLEIGWRLRRDCWGKGFASEAARRMTRFAFDQLSTPKIVAVCAKDNLDSAQVMQRLGMRFRGIEPWRGEEAVVYEMTVEEWSKSPARVKAMDEVVPEEVA